MHNVFQSWAFMGRGISRAVCFKGGGGGAQRIITDDQRAVAEVATKQWNDYQSTYVPFEKRFIDQQQEPVEEKQAAGRGTVNADVQQTISKVAPINPNRGMAPMGVVPAAAVKSLSSGFTDVSQKAVDNKAAGMGTAVALGRGQQVETLEGMSDQAAASGQIANAKMLSEVENDINERGRILGNVGTAVGMAAGAAKSGMAPSLSKKDIVSGASDDPSGYSVKNNGMYWNNGNYAGNLSSFN